MIQGLTLQQALLLDEVVSGECWVRPSTWKGVHMAFAVSGKEGRLFLERVPIDRAPGAGFVHSWALLTGGWDVLTPDEFYADKLPDVEEVR